MDITEVARRSGLPASTLRFYEGKGLIASIGRRGLHRVFDPDVVERLALIALGRFAGFSLDEIRLMFTTDGQPYRALSDGRRTPDEAARRMRRKVGHSIWLGARQAAA